MNVAEIGKLIGEEVAKKPEICWYPGGFKPPHKGHLAAAQQLAAKPYITQVNVLIGHGKRGGITAEQSKAIWDIYLKAQPNPKIKVDIAKTKSPIKDLYRWFGDDLNREAYVAAAGKEADDLEYFKGLKEAFGDRVQEEIIDDQFVDSDGDRVSGTDFRATIAELRQRYLQVKNNPGDKKALNDYNTTYNYFKDLFPEAVIQKGYLDDIQRVLGINFPEPASLQEGTQPNPKKQPQWVWLEYKSQNKLNPLIFDTDDKVDPKVKELLLKVANYFWEGLEIPEPFEDILLTGSSVNYNYTPTSDIDLHIVVDFDKFENPELLKKYFDEAKVNWNRVHDLKLGKQNIEVYIQDNKDHPEYRGEYSLMNDKWLRKPSFIEINIPDEEIEKKAKLFKQQIDKLEKIGKNNPEKAIELTNKIKERLKNFRQTGLDEDGEYSLENLAFKNLRNTGYLEKLNNLKNSFIDKTLSLNESVDKNSLFEKFMTYACNELQIQNPPSFEIRYEYGEDQPSFGAYVPSKHHIFVNPSNRNIVDVLRTLAHELVHAKQNEMGLLRPDSGETGSEHENDANAIAGILMRDYGKQNPSIYSIGMLNESLSDITGGNKLYHHTSESNLTKILNNDTLLGTKPDDDYLKYDKKLASTPTKSAISFTRDKNFKPNQTIGQSVEDQKTSDLNCIIVLSKDKLKTKYKIESFNYDSIDPRNKYTEKNKEYEDRVLIDKITPLKNYIVDIIYKGNNPKIKQLIDNYLKKDNNLNEAKENWKKTSWKNEKGQKITISQLLNTIKDYPVIQAPIEKVKKIIIKKETGGIEFNRLNKANTQYPIIIVVDNNNEYKYILDGNHRANKAIDNKEKTIPAKLVNINKLPKKFQDVLNESIKKTAGVWDTNEKFKDGSDFKIKFKVSDIIDLAKNTPVKEIDPKSINYDFSGREEDPTKTKDRVNKADLTYPIIVVKNEKGKIFAMLDGTHRLEKALNLELNKIKTKILNKEDLIQFKTDKLNEAKETNPPITRIYFDLDGVLAGFDDQFKKYNKENLDFKSYIGKYGANEAWDIINKGKIKFWSTMPWNPGGQELYNKVMELADEKGFEVWILSSPGLDPNGDAKKGKNLWVDKHLNIPENRRVYKQAKNKYTEAKPGYMLIDDMGANVSQFIQAGGTGIKNNPEDSRESIKKLYKFKYE